jgi:porphobilinogen synthase
MSETPTTQRDGATFSRHRRLRATPALRRLVRETRLDASRLVQPLFVQDGGDGRNTIASMPGVQRLGTLNLAEEAQELHDLGLGGTIVFGIPAAKDSNGSAASGRHGIAQRAVRALKQASPLLTVIADVCLCEYTSHGHCGVLSGSAIDNDATLAILARAAVSLADAGADIVAPSAMMDGQVNSIRRALDEAGHTEVPILAYASKQASAFYGPFREAADSAPAFGDRRSYQMDPANAREAMREIESDLREGADMILVKPALPCLDIIHAARQRFDAPIGAFQVSGEYTMIKAASANGWLDEARVVNEALTAIQRAGADFTISYFAKDMARRLNEGIA